MAGLTDARLVPIQMFGRQVVEIVLKATVGIQAKVAQKRPGIDTRTVHVVETDPHRIVSNGVDRQNGNIALAADGLPLCLGMALHLCRGTGDPKKFGGQDMGRPVIE